MSAPRDMQDEARKYLDRTMGPGYADALTERVKPVPMVRIRISTDFQASTKRIEPSVTVEIVAPADGTVDMDALELALEIVRSEANREFDTALTYAEEAIANRRPAVGDKS